MTAVARAGRLAGRLPIWAWLLALVALSAAVRVLLSSNAPAPWIFVDELIYSELGKSAADGGPLAIREVANNGYGYVYPYLLAPAYALFDRIPDAYDAIRITNAVLMSSAAVPTYLLARRLASRPLAFLAAALAVSIPAMVYTSVVMTENAFYPLFLLAALALVRAIERPTPLRQALVLVAIVACFYTRSQAVALFPALVCAYALWAVLETRAADEPLLSRHLVRRLWRFAGTWIVLAAGVVLVLAVQLGRGQPLSSLLGAYAVTTSSERYSLAGVVRWFLWHVAELDLWLGLLPFLAFVVLCTVALTRGASPRTRVYVAAAVPLVFWLTLVVAAFALYTGNERIEERNLFYVGALFLVALVWWLGAGLPRPRVGFGVGLLLAVALPGVLPYASFINVSAVSDTFGLLPLWAVQDHLATAAYLPAVVLVGCIAAGVLALVLPARWWLVVPAVVLAYYAAGQAPVETKTDAASQGSLFEGIRTTPDWIDRAVPDGAEVAVVWSGAPSPLAVFENEFFNRSVGPIYRLPTGAALRGACPRRC
ncbi:MAG: glycosyltransferase family 39 protein [Thermoleophilia bacterium]